MDNADLDKLKITPGRLLPKFSPKTVQYSVTVGSEVSEIKLTSITSDSGASTTVKGDANSKIVPLKEGKTSNVELVVTAEDGHTTKTYSISIHRLSPGDACLAQLDLSTGKLQPSFSPTTLTYYCDLPSNVTQIGIKTKTEDSKMKVTLKGGAPVSTVTLAAGLTPIEITVTSPNGHNTTLYTINALRLCSPYIFHLKQQNIDRLCTACSATPHCPCRVSTNTDSIYCRQCLMSLSRVNKLDPMTSKQLGEAWLQLAQDVDKDLSEQLAVCDTPFGKIEGKIGELPALIAQKTSNSDEETVSCGDCSKKVPSLLVDLHKQMSCSAKVSEAPIKTEVQSLFWEKRLINDTLPSKVDDVLAKTKTAEEKYLAALKEQDFSSSADILDLLKTLGSCYATAIKVAPRDPRGHVGLGVVMEEMFYIGDMYGVKDIESSETDDESEAEISSKEEEFLAICKLHGVSESANLAQQLRAVEAEYKSLRQAGQGHKAEHVQQLYQWKSKKALAASKGSYAVDTESPLYRARVKYEHAVSVQPTDHSACYHLGRLCLLLGDIPLAEKCLKMAASIKPMHSETILCLGSCLQSESQPSSKLHSKALLTHGLRAYIQVRDEVSVGKRLNQLQSLHANDFWRPTNTIIGEAFIMLGNLGGQLFLDQTSCYKSATRLFSASPGLQKGDTVNQLLWILIRARAALADNEIKLKSPQAGKICRQVSALINHCQLPPNEGLRTLQMKVFEDGVLLEPTNSIALSRLGAAQLQQYDAMNEKVWLDNAEKSFRGSIGCEGKQDNGTEPPREILEQGWWKKRKEGGTLKPAGASATPTSKAATPTSKAATPTNKAATTTPVKPSASKTTTASTKTTTPVKSTGPVGRGARQPATTRPVAGGRGVAKGGAQPTTNAKGRGVATLGELKTGAKKPGAAQQKTPVKSPDPPAKPAETKPDPVVSDISPTPSSSNNKGKINEVSYHPRLGLARVLAKQEAKSEESVKFYNEVIKMAPEIHDAYIELGEILAKKDPVGAVAIYAKFPFSDPPSFDDAYLHGEIVRLLMSSEAYDEPQLVTSMIAMGRALGIGVLDKNVGILEAKFKTKVLKKVYAGVHGKDIDNPELQAFFKFKCWT